MTQIKCKSCEDPKLVFVFGSNEAGVHGAGAAKHAYEFHSAEPYLAFGPDSPEWPSSFAIPTKDKDIKSLKLWQIFSYVSRFIGYANYRPDLVFNVTRIGCGLAGYADKDIAPMFKDAPPNCILPDGWR